jgi:hypothetical protein
LAQQDINRHQRRRHRNAKRVTIDLDSTADPTHGQQEHTLFNRHYDSYCYLPLLAFDSYDDEPAQHLLTALLRPSNDTEKHPVIVGLLARLVLMVRAAFPQALINLRLDGGFACPALFAYLDSVPRLEYVCGLAKNAVLERRAQPLLAQARQRQKQGRKPRLYGECRYRAQTWDRARRVVIKAEIVHNCAGEAKDNPRFVVTNKRQAAKFIYRQAYCSRGEIENRIKELQLGMEIDRTSCTRFQANQFRVLLTVAAYGLLQEIRLQAQPTKLARAQVTTLRQQLLKLSARLEQSVRRIVVHLPQSFAYLNEWTRIARKLGAVPS